MPQRPPCVSDFAVAFLSVGLPCVFSNGMEDRQGFQTKPNSLKMVSSDKEKKKNILIRIQGSQCLSTVWVCVCVYLGSSPKTSSAVLWTKGVTFLAYTVTSYKSGQEWTFVGWGS